MARNATPNAKKTTKPTGAPMRTNGATFQTGKTISETTPLMIVIHAIIALTIPNLFQDWSGLRRTADAAVVGVKVSSGPQADNFGYSCRSKFTRV